jgi:multidrug efflux system membrane fusion protein
VKADHTVEQRSVVVGQRTGGEVIIKKGLKADETVVLNGQINLYPGAAVAIKGQGGGK